jgi:hypothetical protein
MMSVPSASSPFLATEPEFKNELVKSYAEACGCPYDEYIGEAVECLQNVDVQTMVNQSIAWQGSGTSLGGYIRENVFEAIYAGEYPRVPVVVTATRDEGTALAYGFKPNSTEEVFLASIRSKLSRPRNWQ